MQFTSKFDIGQTVFVITYDNTVEGPYTIGQIRIEHTDSPGIKDEDGLESMFENYKPQKGYSESYMLLETGVGSGTLWDAAQCFTTYINAQNGLVEKLIADIHELKTT